MTIMASAAVRTRATTNVSLRTSGEASLPAPGPRVPLSPFDTRWVTLPPHNHVFLFPAPSSETITFPDIVCSLKSSLAKILPSFHPFAGEIIYSPESRTIDIVCGEDAHVAFVEAETDMEFKRLAEDSVQDVAAFRWLVPDIVREKFPAPVLAVQVTEFVGGSGGGVAVGVAMNHMAMDGRGFFQFLEMWAAAAKGDVAEGKTVPVLHDRMLLRFEYDDEQVGVYLQHVAPDLPRMMQENHNSPPLSCRNFMFTASALCYLKELLAAAEDTGKKPSTFVALGAHAWVSIAKCRGFTDGARVFAAFPADCRALLSPPVPDGYAGNCVTTCLISLTGEELTGPDGLARASSCIRTAIAEVKRDPLAHWRDWFAKVEEIAPGPMVILTGSPTLSCFGVDFGFGRPARSDLASIHQDNQVVMSAGRDDGSVQVSVAITADWMPALSEIFKVDA
ncbi:hypothetical protein QOZ80_9BG0694240 [Eleusine coracana subsp. coracana]|nr:hypothetical protein QOZ80_9BG0694240 [Eleusine coracana subsp. coracana]